MFSKTRLKAALYSNLGQSGVILLLFVICQFLALYVFYNGFLTNFALLFGRMTAFPLLTDTPYHAFSILSASLVHPIFAGTLLLFYLPLFLKRKEYALFLYTRSHRLIVFVCAFILAWELTTYDYNYYLDKAFYFDRIMLLVPALLLLRSPVFLPLFIAWAYLYRSQFNYPLEGFMLFDKQVLFDVLLMYMAYLYAKILFPFIKISFLFLTFCIVGSDYFMCAAAKILISPHGYEWLFQNDPVNLFQNVHSRGWLAKNPENTINTLSSFLSQYGKIFQTAVFSIEFSALFLLRSRRFAVLLLSCFCALHIGIFIFGSMLFWKWMAVDLILLLILWKKKSLEEELFSKKLFLCSLLIILSSFIWLKPVRIAWYDTPVNQYFTYEVTDSTGRVFELDKNQMNPYHQWFQYDKFLFLVNEPCLPVSGFGYTGNYKIAQVLKNTDVGTYNTLEMKFGKNHFDPAKKQEYDSFIKTYFTNRNRLLGINFIPYFLRAPHHLHSEAFGTSYNNQFPVRLFRVIFNKSISKNGKMVVIEKKTVDEVIIP